MVVGPLTGKEIDFPNLPSEGDEYQAPNKFLYKWTDENRWKNIHRPLIITDYLWPELPSVDGPGNNDDPTDDSATDGGVDFKGPGDWRLQALVFPAMPMEANITVDILCRTKENGDDPYGTFSHYVYDADYKNAAEGEGRYHPNNDQRLIIYDNVVSREDEMRARIGQTPPSGPYNFSTFSTEAGANIASMPTAYIIDYRGRFLSASVDLLNILPQPEFRDQVEVRYTFYAKGFSNRDGGGTAARVNFINDLGYTFPLDPEDRFPEVPLASIREYSATGLVHMSDWLKIPSQCRYVEFEFQMITAAYEVGEIQFQFRDPNSPPNTDVPPVGFACDRDMNYSLISFKNDEVNYGYVRTVRHGNPAQLDNSDYTSNVLYGESMLDLDGNPSTYTFGPMFLRDDGNMWAFAQIGSSVIEMRHLAVPFDLSKTSHTEDSDDLFYSYRERSSISPNLGGVVKNFDFNPEGDKLFVLYDSGNIEMFPVTTPWDLSTVNTGASVTLNLSSFGATSFEFAGGGHNIILMKEGFIKQIILDTPYDLTTAIDTGFVREFYIQNPIDIYISPDANNMFVLDTPAILTEGFVIYRYYRET